MKDRKCINNENLKKIPKDIVRLLEMLPKDDILGDLLYRVPGDSYVFDDIYVVFVRFLPTYVSRMPENYMGYFAEDIEEDPLNDFYDHLAYDVMKGCDPGIIGSSKWPDYFLEYTYFLGDKCFRLAIVQERRLSQDPIYKNKSYPVPEVIIANNNKLKSWEELEADIKNWCQKIKGLTDQL